VADLELRASDAERERTATALREACAEGRLSVDELGERLAVAYSARTVGALDAVLADLPRVARHVTAAPAGLPRVPGNRIFSERIVVPTSRETVLDRVYAILGPVLDAYDYELKWRDDRAVVFEQDERPGWSIAVAVFLFPFGLLALTARRKRRVVFSLTERDGLTELTVYGTAPLGIRRAFARLREAD
jgi:DUF1707 SHOCT-like domain